MPEKTIPTAPSTAKRLEGKIAIVTGGSKGIGEATVRLFATHGAKVVIADVDDAPGSALATELSPSVTYIRCNVSSEEDVINLINSTVTRFGKLDIMFNNAGMLGKQSSILEFNVEEFDTLMNVNVRGVGLGMKHAARVMIPRGSGCIISTASVAAVIGGLGPHSYTASKHAVLGLTKNVACELGKYGIRVNCISPFAVATTMMKTAWKSINAQTDDEDDSSSVGQIEEWVSSVANLKKATLKTEDVAEAALYLVSDESKYVSGHNLVLDGGITTSSNCVGVFS